MGRKYNVTEEPKSPLYKQAYVNVGDGPVVILLHGLFGNVAMWKKTIDALQNHFRVIVPRLPIFDLPIHHTSVKYLIQALDDFIAWHQLKDVTLVGHAMGGQVALMYANTHPANVSRLVLSGSLGLFQDLKFDEVTLSEIDDYEFVQDKVREAFYEPEATPRHFVEEIYSTVQNIPKRLIIGAFVKSSNQNGVTYFLNKLDHPVLLLWGLEDRITPPEVALHFHDYLQNSEIQWIEECGHMPMVEKAELFNSYLLSFIK